MSSEKVDAGGENGGDVSEEWDNKLTKPGQHNVFRAGVIMFTALFFLIVVFFNFFSSSEIGRSSGLFVSSTMDTSDSYYIEITPAGWTFSIWGFIYVWQIIWLIYAIVNIFRRNSLGERIYLSPEMEPPVFYFFYVLNMGCNLAWIFLFDRRLVGWSLLPIALLPFSLYICIAISLINLVKNGHYMMKIGMNKDIWLSRFFVQNGLAFYATWVTIATLLNFSIMLSYRAGVDQSTSSTVSLCILAVEIVAWFILDVFVIEKYTRYLFSPYIVVNFALAGSLAKNFTPDNANSILSLCLLAVGMGATVVKVIMLFYRHKTRPLFSNSIGDKAENVDMA